MKIDMHVHSSYSEDGHTSPADIIAHAKELGLGGIAITDHDSFEAFFDVKDDDFIVIPGEEVSSKRGHILAFGIDKPIKKHMSIKDTIEAIHEAGGIAIAAHPYRFWTGLGHRNSLKGGFDGIEALNARSTKGANNRSKRLSEVHGGFITAGSDSHRPGTLGHGYVEVPDTCQTWQDVLEAIRNKDAIPFSSDRKWYHSLRYTVRCMFNWCKRGFRDM